MREFVSAGGELMIHAALHSKILKMRWFESGLKMPVAMKIAINLQFLS